MKNNEFSILIHWIGRNLTPTQQVNREITSYGLKEIPEKELGIYISNDEYKIAMTSMGYEEFLSETPGNPYYKFKFATNKQKIMHDEIFENTTDKELLFEVELKKEYHAMQLNQP